MKNVEIKRTDDCIFISDSISNTTIKIQVESSTHTRKWSVIIKDKERVNGCELNSRRKRDKKGKSKSGSVGGTISTTLHNLHTKLTTLFTN